MSSYDHPRITLPLCLLKEGNNFDSLKPLTEEVTEKLQKMYARLRMESDSKSESDKNLFDLLKTSC